jgi:hypothetical protein
MTVRSLVSEGVELLSEWSEIDDDQLLALLGEDVDFDALSIELDEDGNEHVFAHSGALNEILSLLMMAGAARRRREAQSSKPKEAPKPRMSDSEFERLGKEVDQNKAREAAAKAAKSDAANKDRTRGFAKSYETAAKRAASPKSKALFHAKAGIHYRKIGDTDSAQAQVVKSKKWGRRLKTLNARESGAQS